MSYAKQLQELMIHNGYAGKGAQTKLAEDCGLAANTISKILSGGAVTARSHELLVQVLPSLEPPTAFAPTRRFNTMMKQTTLDGDPVFDMLVAAYRQMDDSNRRELVKLAVDMAL